MKFSLILMLIWIGLPPGGQSGTASIGGLVTLSGKPASSVTVTLVELDAMRRSEAYRWQRDGAIAPPFQQRATTDAEGRYRLSNLPAGSYRLRVESKSAVLASAGAGTEKTITVDDGESREDVNFDFIRGGVITGRVTDENGKPLIAALIRVSVLREVPGGPDKTPQFEMRRDGHSEMYQTDDRGIYRVYGLPKGRYIVGSGSQSHVERPAVRLASRRARRKPGQTTGT
jgi:Carboxypeptidase regulatory-like domain